MKILCFPLWLNIRDLYQALIKTFSSPDVATAAHVSDG
jgi:hypothetical protein